MKFVWNRLFSKASILVACVAFGILLNSNTEAFIGFDPCCNRGMYYGEIELLYWQPSHDPIFDVQKQNATSPYQREIVYLEGENYDPGFRVRLGYQFCDWLADVSYLYLHTSDVLDQERGTFEFMLPLGGGAATNLDFAEARERYWYQNADFRLGHKLYQRCSASAFTYVNVRWVDIDFKNRLEGTTTSGTEYKFKQSSDFNGGAFGFGLGAHYTVCGSLGIGGHFGAMAVTGRTRYNFTSYEGGATLSDIYIPSRIKWGHLLPAYDFRVSLDFTFGCGCLRFTGEIGYEANFYNSVLFYASENIIAHSGSDRVPVLTSQDLGFSGPFFSICTRF